MQMTVNEPDYVGRKGGPFVTHGDPLDIARFRDLVHQMRDRHPSADLDMLLDLVDARVEHDDAMRRVVVKQALVNALNYFDKGPTEQKIDATASITVTTSKPYKPRPKKTEEQKKKEEALVNLAHFNLAMSYKLSDGRTLGEHTAGEAFDFHTERNTELAKIIVRFGRDVTLNSLTQANLIEALT